MRKSLFACLASLFVACTPVSAADRDLPDLFSDHFLCSIAVQSDVQLPTSDIALEDQFGGVRVQLTRLKYICSPTSKSYTDNEGKKHTAKIRWPQLHLACYAFSPKPLFMGAEIMNQITNDKRQSIGVRNRELLCVPSFKRKR